MSWNIFVQDIPSDAKCVADIPDGFRPQPIGPRARVLDTIREVIPFADFSDGTWVRVDGAEVSMEISIDDEDPLSSFAFFIRGGEAAPGIVAEVLNRLNLRAFDSGSESGIFDPTNAADSLHKWQQYRGHVCRPKTS